MLKRILVSLVAGAARGLRYGHCRHCRFSARES